MPEPITGKVHLVLCPGQLHPVVPTKYEESEIGCPLKAVEHRHSGARPPAYHTASADSGPVIVGSGADSRLDT